MMMAVRPTFCEYNSMLFTISMLHGRKLHGIDRWIRGGCQFSWCSPLSRVLYRLPAEQIVMSGDGSKTVCVCVCFARSIWIFCCFFSSHAQNSTVTTGVLYFNFLILLYVLVSCIRAIFSLLLPRWLFNVVRFNRCFPAHNAISSLHRMLYILE